MFVVYITTTGALVSTTSALGLVVNPLPANLSVKQVPDPAIGFVWNQALLDFVQGPTSRVVSKSAFINRFTITELKEMFGYMHGATYTAAEQKNLAAVMRYLDFNDEIDLDNTNIQTGIGFLVTKAILTPVRAAQVLA